MALLNWVKLPTKWIRQEQGGLRNLRWTANDGANNLAALMTLIIIAHHAEAEVGTVRLTYDQLSQLTSLSRAKVSGGIKILTTMGVIKPRVTGHSPFELEDFDPKAGWAKLPARRLYTHGRVELFSQMTLRKPAELHALKLYLLFVAMRDDNTNLAHITYQKIEEYTGVEGHAIKRALSLLAANGLVHIEHMTSQHSKFGIANAYRIAGIDDRRHLGTVHRRTLADNSDFSTE